MEVLQLLHEETMAAYRVLESKNDILSTYYANEEEDSEVILQEIAEYIEESDRRKIHLHSQYWKVKEGQASVKVKSLPPPNFSGELRIFGTFLKDYDNVKALVN